MNRAKSNIQTEASAAEWPDQMATSTAPTDLRVLPPPAASHERANPNFVIIITAMDRFVWFVLLVVMSHLVAEFTRVTGYARGNRNELLMVNDTLIEPKTIQNMLLYPGQPEFGLYEAAAAPQTYYYPGGSNGVNNYPPPPYNGINSAQQQQQQQQQKPNGQIIAAPGNTQSGLVFSFRPLIDSIFEIPISTLRAVNNLIARLTGSYQAATAPFSPQKSVLPIEIERSNNIASSGDSSKMMRDKKSILREEIE